MTISGKGTRFHSLRVALLVALSSFLLHGTESLVPSRTQILTCKNTSRSNHEPFERKLETYKRSSHLGQNSLFTRGGSSSSNNISASSHPLYSSSSSASNSQPSSSVPSSQYYLLLSSSIWRNITLQTMVLFILQAIFQKIKGTTSTVASCHTSHSKIILFLYKLMPILKQISLPLLSSACCILQLFLNAFFAGAGCAGFNTKLGPIRPYFVSILLFTSIQSFSVNGWRILQLFLSWCIALMPELIHFKNELNTQHTVNDAMYDGLASVNDCRKAVVELDIQDMGCVACINKIDATLRSSSDLGIQDAKSWLNGDGVKGGKAKIELILEDSYSNENTIDLVVEKIVNLVKSTGFQCSLANVHVE
ncbi:hypothetical protein CTEN210_08928 [Chaetoceros tenuissimus]|uniref:HMA domain-containing protein n=1 Tax=Chaetoceros tenuissimus TaxID=426638 RepID=A0AAD3CUG8_9STRA|nr:hypothetical protein CTEN210_08928 [Chaetoceros tenuissimus]